MKIEGRVGEIISARGGDEQIRMGPYADVIVSELQGRYFTLALRDKLFRSFVRAVTIAATHNTPIAAATATPVLGLLNPKDSNKALVLLRAAFGTTSGTPAGGQGVINVISGVGNLITATQTGSIFRGI